MAMSGSIPATLDDPDEVINMSPNDAKPVMFCFSFQTAGISSLSRKQITTIEKEMR
jgi:hypothetical protein